MLSNPQPLERPTVPAPPSSDARLVPSRIGGYRVLGRLGAGSMGTVYRARGEALGREVAVKVCSDPTTPQGQRFLREARALASVDHPNLPFVVEHGEDESGRPYLVLEYLRGANLMQLVQIDGFQPVARVIHVLRQLAAALWAVHARGLVHRDVKPSNVVLTRHEGCDDVVKLVDFGLVLDRFAPQDCEANPCGTRGYLAPEALEPGIHLDGRADIYGLGAVGQFLLLGDHADAHPSGLDALIEHGTTPVLESLVELLRRCCASDRDERPRDARELFVALRELAASAPWHPVLAERWWSGFAGPWGECDDEATVVDETSWRLWR